MSVNRIGIVNSIRGLLRLVNVNPFSDADIFHFVEFAVDDFSERAPFAIAIDRTHGIKGQREYVLPTDILEVVESYYKDEVGTTLTEAIADATHPPTTADHIHVTDSTDFAASGTIKIDDEEISYTSKSTGLLVGITRGVNNTVAVGHLLSSGVIEINKKWVLLEPKTTRQLADVDESWLSAANGVPTQYYIFPGVFGFEVPPNKGGYFNVMLRNLIRPAELTTDTSIISGLIVTFYKAIVHYGAAKLAQILAQDDAAVAQSTVWLQEYLADIAIFKKNQHLYTRGLRSQVIPKVNRPSGF